MTIHIRTKIIQGVSLPPQILRQVKAAKISCLSFAIDLTPSEVIVFVSIGETDFGVAKAPIVIMRGWL